MFRSHPLVAIVNHSTKVSNAEALNAVPALQRQVTHDFAPIWDAPASLVFYTDPTVVPPDAWVLGIFDNSDQAGALGYHDVTAAGLPIGKAFVGTAQADDVEWASVVSHELLELLADPYCSLAFQVTNTSFVAEEVCDAVEAESYTHPGADGAPVAVSNFVTPYWFSGVGAKRLGAALGLWDFLGDLTAAHQLAIGGYISIFISGHGWTQQVKTADGHIAAQPLDPNDSRFRNRAEGHVS